MRDPARQHTQKSSGGDADASPAAEQIKLKPVGPWTCINVIDMDRQQLRLGTLADMIDATKLLLALGIEGRKIWPRSAPATCPARCSR